MSNIHGRLPRSVSQYDRKGNFIKRWHSGMEAEKELKISYKNIISCCKGTRQTAGGYIWAYGNTTYGLHQVVLCQCCGKKVDANFLVQVSIEHLQILKDKAKLVY